MDSERLMVLLLMIILSAREEHEAESAALWLKQDFFFCR